MRTFAAVTTCHKQGYELYGQTMMETFDRHWPEDVALYFYAEGFAPPPISERVVLRNLLADCPDLVAFKRRHKNNPVAHGAHGRRRLEIRVEWHKPKMKIQRVEWGLGYPWDAVRFSHKSFAIFDAAARCPADVLFWIDADIVVFDDVPRAFLEELMPRDCLLSFLKRPKFSECGFVGYNLRHPEIRNFFARFQALYTTDRLFKQREYHDSYLFDVIRRRFERKGCRTHDIAEGLGQQAGHVFVNSKLGRYMDHMKGDRKIEGSSRQEDFVVARNEEYWKRTAS